MALSLTPSNSEILNLPSQLVHFKKIDHLLLHSLIPTVLDEKLKLEGVK